jgi:hypothetical protein
VFRAEVIAGNKRVLVRPDVVITVRPIMNAAPAIEARFRRQRRPADVVLTRTPRDPGGCPFVARYPHPANATEPDPAPIVIGRPTKSLVRDPCPAGVGINPMALGVGTPIARRFRFARLPDVTIFARFPPIAVRIEFLVKHSVGRGRARLRTCAAVGSFGHRFFFSGSGRSFFDRRRASGRCGFPISQRFLARVQLGLLFRQLFLVGRRLFRGEAILDLAFDLSFSFFFGLLLLTGDEKGQGNEQRENGELLHGVVRPC